ncbi:helix-turn-helix transcriptional regulator [Streptosporangium sp. G11]|uniref:helix-turn-helix transcriptional regulator n=1 Tax=Streptosporangium sp. G11 TaxID=3436926 RepID=UPI003EB84B91
MSNSMTEISVLSTQRDPFSTTAEVAARYRTSPSTVRYWRHAGIGPHGVKIGTKVLYRESELIRWELAREAEQNGAA